MNEDLHTRIVPGRDSTTEDRIRVSVMRLRQMLSDATGQPVTGFDRVASSETDQLEARSWLLHPSTSVAVACDVTGVDMGALNN